MDRENREVAAEQEITEITIRSKSRVHSSKKRRRNKDLKFLNLDLRIALILILPRKVSQMNHIGPFIKLRRLLLSISL